MTKNCCPGFAFNFPFNQDSAGFNFFTFTPHTLNISFRARAAYQLRNVSNLITELLMISLRRNGRIWCKALYPEYCQIYYYWWQFYYACTIAHVRNFLVSHTFQIDHTIVKYTLLSILLHSSLIIPRYSKWCTVVRSIVHAHKDLRICDEVSEQKQVGVRAMRSERF